MKSSGIDVFFLQIGALEKQVKEVLREVLSLRNLLRPVNHLPPEVLASCATFVSDADPRPIIPLTHVCRYWRESITSNPRNWASIAIQWERLAPLCYERAGAVPLAVDITVTDVERDEHFLNELLPHVPKIGSLRITGHSFVETVAYDLPGFFGPPMLRLTSLELQQTEEPAQLLPIDDAPVPPPFRNVSKLKSLSLTQTPLYPTLFTIRSLVELKLTGYTIPFQFGTLLGLLDSNPNLELVVLDIKFVAGSVETTPARKVPLARLHHLSITCSEAVDSKGLLSCIHLPHGAHIDVVSTRLAPSAALHSFLPSPLTPILELLTPITTIKTQVTPRELHVSGNGSVFTLRSPGPARARLPELTLFPTTAVRELHTNIHPHKYSDPTLLLVLKGVPALETFAISRTTFPVGLLSALTEEPVLCPSLKTIAFFDCVMDSDVTKRLGEAIAKRGGLAAVRLYRVVIVSSTGSLPDLASIQQLRRSVPCVEVRLDDKLPNLS